MGVLGGASAPAVPDGTLKARGGTSMERIKIFGETGRKLGQKAFQKNCEIAGLDEARAALASITEEGK